MAELAAVHRTFGHCLLWIFSILGKLRAGESLALSDDVVLLQACMCVAALSVRVVVCQSGSMMPLAEIVLVHGCHLLGTSLLFASFHVILLQPVFHCLEPALARMKS